MHNLWLRPSKSRKPNSWSSPLAQTGFILPTSAGRAEALSANDIDVRHCEIKSNYGHDAFLLESGQMNYAIGNFLSRMSVGDVMIKEVVTIRQGSSVEEAARVMMTGGVTHLPVISREGKLAGSEQATKSDRHAFPTPRCP